MRITSRLNLAIIIFTIVPLVLLIIGGFLYGSLGAKRFLVERVKSVNTEVIRQVNLRTAGYTRSLDEWVSSELFTMSIPALNGTGDRTTAMRELNESLPSFVRGTGIEDIVIFGSKGQLLYSTQTELVPQFNTVPSDVMLQEMFRIGSGGDKTHMLADETTTAEKHYSVFLMRAIRDGRSLQALVAFHVPVSAYQNIFDATHSLGKTAESLVAINETSSALIVSTAIGEKNPTDLRIPFNTNRGMDIQRAVRPETGVGDVIDYTGQPAIAAWGYVENLEVGVTSRITQAEAISVLESMRNAAIVIIVVLILLLLVVPYTVIHLKLSRPLTHLTEIAQQLADGQAPDKVNFGLAESGGEIGRIAMALHNLAQTAKHGTPAAAEAPDKNPPAMPHDHLHRG